MKPAGNTLSKEEKEKLKKKLLAKKKRLLQKKSELLITKNEKLVAVREYEEKNKLLYFGHPGKGYLGEHGTWSPNKPQAALIRAVEHTDCKIFAAVGGNQQGKTTFEVILALAIMRGHWPWEDPKVVGHWIWEKFGWRPPIYVRWIGGGWEEHIQKNLIEQGLEELWPDSWPIKTRNNNMGVRYIWRDESSGNQIQFMSHNQSRKAFAGWKGHATIFDEPFPPEIWLEVMRGLIAKGGICFIGASLVEEDQSWIDDEILDKDYEEGDTPLKVYKYVGKMTDNIGHGLTEKSVREFTSLLSADDKKIRVEGISAGKKAKILKFRDLHFLEKSILDIPPDYLVDVAIDYHPNKPVYIDLLATGPYNVQYFCHEIISDSGISGNAKWMGSAIIKVRDTHNLRINRIIMDPLAKGNRNALENDDETVFSQLSDYLAAFGLYLETASKHKDDGIIATNAKLNEATGPPSLYVYKSCPVAVRQLKKWRFNELGRPSKEDDDSCENLYRLINLRTEYTPPQPEQIGEYYSGGIFSKNPTTGY